jgi:hypothetical protein
VCLIVSLGFVEAVPLGFYRFRLVDLVLHLSVVYFVGLTLAKRVSRAAVVWLLLAHASVLAVRITADVQAGLDAEGRRTLFGMTALYLAPVVFFVVRESRLTAQRAWRLVLVACGVCLLSQLGLLPWAESYASGTVTLGQLLNIPPRPLIELPYQETTITVWRALSVGLTIAALVASTSLGVKCLGLAGLFVQFAGGGGGRSQFLFAIAAPLVLVLARQGRGRAALPVRLAAATVIGVALAGFYLWSPVGARGAVKGDFKQTHYERVSELFTILSGWQAVTDAGGLNGRTVGYAEYWTRITSDPQMFWFGAGLTGGETFVDTPNKLAHNMVLDVWALSGLVGLAFHLVFVGWVMADMRRLLTSAPAGGRGQVVAFTYATAVIYLFQWLLFQAAGVDRSFMIVFYLLSGVLRPLARTLQPSPQSGHLARLSPKPAARGALGPSFSVPPLPSTS